MASRQRDELIASTGEERIGTDEQRTSPLLDERREGCVDLAFAARHRE